jgi:hypothetical protein
MEQVLWLQIPMLTALMNFTPPDASVVHQLQSSADLVHWQPEDVEGLTDLGEGFTRSFQFNLGADAERFYRAAVLPPLAILSEDFENGVGEWMVETASGDTPWELGTPDASG